MAPWTIPAIHRVTVNRSCPTRISQKWTFASFTLWISRPEIFVIMKYIDAEMIIVTHPIVPMWTWPGMYSV